MNILGINFSHADTSAVLLSDGKIICAIEEERFSRIKHHAGFPKHSIDYCLKSSGLTINDIDYFCVNTRFFSNIYQKIIFFIKNFSMDLLFTKRKHTLSRLNCKNEIKSHFKDLKKPVKLINIDHHLTHISSAYRVSGFDKCLGMTVDGSGDFCTTALFDCSKDKIHYLKKVFYPHSLGTFYQTMTQFLGFKNYGDEYKVMGLASFGKPKFKSELKKILFMKNKFEFELNLDYFNHQNSNYPLVWSDNRPVFRDYYTNKMCDLFGEARKKDEKINQFHMDLASSVQYAYEDIFFTILNEANLNGQYSNLSLAGGCALNSTANGKIIQNTKFKEVFIQPNAGDAGGALGAALELYSRKTKKNCSRMTHAYYGSKYTDPEIKNTINKFNFPKNIKIEYYENFEKLTDFISYKIKSSCVVGWFQGKMEWGPRALGNRSILGDPTNPNIKDIINLKIKRRESFRPFAPSVIKERANEFFDLQSDDNFMLKVSKVKTEKVNLIPAITHIDGTARVQTVTKDSNLKYYKLLEKFEQHSKVPILLNTSFNENEPIVETPEQAINCFLRTDMDILSINNFVIFRIKLN